MGERTQEDGNLPPAVKKANQKKAAQLDELMKRCADSLVVSNKTKISPKITHKINPMYKAEDEDPFGARLGKRSRVLGSTSTEDLLTPEQPLIKKAVI